MLLTFLTIGFSPSDLVVSIEIVQAVPLFTIFLPRLIIFSATSLHELPCAKSFVPTCRIIWDGFPLQEWFQEILHFFCVSTRERMGLYNFCP